MKLATKKAHLRMVLLILRKVVNFTSKSQMAIVLFAGL